MHRIDGAGHVDNLFVTEDAATSRAPTEITDDWLNAAQEEVCAVIEAAGLTLDKGNNAQLLAALQSIFASRAGVQQATYSSAYNTGTVDALAATYIPAIGALVDGMELTVIATGANATTTPTFTPHAGTIAVHNIVKGVDAALALGDIPGAGYPVKLKWSATFSHWVQLNPATGVVTKASYKQIQPLPTPTLSGGVLTIPSASYTLDFRSSSLGTGGADTITGSPVALVIPSGATLGTTNGIASQIAVLALNNGGSLEYAVCNLAGGVDLGAEGVISTTALSASSTSSGTVYSAAARASVPYRVLGIYSSTQAAAGTWVSAPTLVQGVGGLAGLAALVGFGAGMSYQNVASSRAAGTLYYNLTGRTIYVLASFIGSTAAATSYANVNGIYFYGTACGQVGNASAVFFPVPAGAYYSATMNSGTATIGLWAEFR